MTAKLVQRVLIGLFLCGLSSLSGWSERAFAADFRNSYLAFQLPESWKCVSEATEWICRHKDSTKSKEALIILTAKEAGPSDSLQTYETIINTPKSILDLNGTPSPSSVALKAKQNLINEHVWIDGLQKGSEIPNYFTRYLATVKDKIAVLVTFSAHSDFFVKYSSEFYRSILSLRITPTKALLTELSSKKATTSGVWDQAHGGVGGLQDLSSLNPDPRRKSGGSSRNNKLLVILISLGSVVALAAAFFFFKSKKRY